MNDSEETPKAGSEEMPEGLPAPPSILPTPEEFGTNESEKKPKNKKQQRHPTDSYEPMKKSKKGCAGCCGCFALFGVIVFAAIGGLAYWVAGPIARFEQITFDDAETTITEAPEKATWYIGKKINYAAPPTEVEIAIWAEEIHITGDFLENVYILGKKVFADKNARFAKGLDIKAAEFTDEGITLKGKLTGRVMENKN